MHCKLNDSKLEVKIPVNIGNVFLDKEGTQLRLTVCESFQVYLKLQYFLKKQRLLE